ncbi:MAG: hypothetical protein M0Q01_12940 [Syntrophales bacterium]|jgi:hypothetical protein|nr:hypothetical protein [Syntrophales bacterium]
MKHKGNNSCNKPPHRKQRGIIRHAGLDPASSFDFWIMNIKLRFPAVAGMTDSRQAAGNVPIAIQLIVKAF